MAYVKLGSRCSTRTPMFGFVRAGSFTTISVTSRSGASERKQRPYSDVTSPTASDATQVSGGPAEHPLAFSSERRHVLGYGIQRPRFVARDRVRLVPEIARGISGVSTPSVRADRGRARRGFHREGLGGKGFGARNARPSAWRHRRRRRLLGGAIGNSRGRARGSLDRSSGLGWARRARGQADRLRHPRPNRARARGRHPRWDVRARAPAERRERGGARTGASALQRQ